MVFKNGDKQIYAKNNRVTEKFELSYEALVLEPDEKRLNEIEYVA